MESNEFTRLKDNTESLFLKRPVLTYENNSLEESQVIMESCKRDDQFSLSPSAMGKKDQNPIPNTSSVAKPKTKSEARRRTEEAQNQAQPDHEIHIWTERERRKKMRNMFSSLHSLLPHLPPKADKSTIVDEAISYIRSLQRSLQLLQTQKLEKQAKFAASTSTSVDYDSNSVVPIFQQQHQHSTREQGGYVNMNLEENMGQSLDLSWICEPTATVMQKNTMDRLTFQTWASPNVVLSVCGENAHILICRPPKQGLLSTIFYILEKHKLDVVTAHISSDNCRCTNMYMIHAHAHSHARHHAYAHVNGGDQYLESTPSYEDAFRSAMGELMVYL